MTKPHFVTTLTVVTALSLANLGTAEPDYPKLIVFGDSLSDTGNLDREGEITIPRGAGPATTTAFERSAGSLSLSAEA